MGQGLTARIEASWTTGGALAQALRPLGALNAAVVALRHRLYRWGWLAGERLDVPVIVIGNRVVGGAGKTPTTLALVQALREAGWHPGIVSRGHGGRASAQGAAPQPVRPDSAAVEVGDEPLLLQRRSGVPLWIGRQRAAAGRALRQAHPEVDVIVCDDGLQHLALARDLEIVVVDAARGFGNGRLLPAGPLREPASRLRHADLVVANVAGGLDLPDGVGAGALRMRLEGDLALPVTGKGPPRPLADFQGQDVHAVAGIGNPQRFFAQLRAAGLGVDARPWPDHHAFQPADITFADSAPVLMTEKDAVKCASFAGERHWYVPVAATFDAPDEARLTQRLAALCKPGAHV